MKLHYILFGNILGVSRKFAYLISVITVWNNKTTKKRMGSPVRTITDGDGRKDIMKDLVILLSQVTTPADALQVRNIL